MCSDEGIREEEVTGDDGLNPTLDWICALTRYT